MTCIQHVGAFILRAFHFVSAESILSCKVEREIRDEITRDNGRRDELVATKRVVAAGLTEEALEGFETRERERRRFIQDKARVNIVAVSISVAIATAILSLSMAPMSYYWQPRPLSVAIAGIAIVVGWAYFTVGGLFAFKVLVLRQYYQLTPSECVGKDEVGLRAVRLFQLEQNQRTALIMTNALEVSLNAIRNGIVAVAIGIVILVLRLFI